MANIFPRSANYLPLKIVFCLLVLGGAVSAGYWYYLTPEYMRAGYQPIQPVPFSHAIHVTQLGMDCRYCHSYVEVSSHSNIPTTQTCMNCHTQIKADSPKLAAVRQSWATGNPVDWIKIHQVPDFAYFNHAVHVNRGISCVECHGRVDQMDEVYHAKPFSMSFCLECHRHPELKLRPPDKITDLGWQAGSPANQLEIGKREMHDWKVESLQTCSACHR